VAILVDAHTGSTSEILSGGLKDIGRARIFGTRTAGAALPSVFKKLPNGDGFQYAIANYISEGGKPLEGIGVTPDQEVKATREAFWRGAILFWTPPWSGFARKEDNASEIILYLYDGGCWQRLGGKPPRKNCPKPKLYWTGTSR
jgi:C-terminal processing protease CtpA/Prc